MCDLVMTVLFVLCGLLFLVLTCVFSKNNHKSDSERRQKRKFSWVVESLPFVFAYFASIFLPNAIFYIAEKTSFRFPSPLSYTDTFLLVVPLAWTVGIAYFQYKIQNEFNMEQERQQNEQKKEEERRQQELKREEERRQQEQRLEDLITALRSLYACSVTAYNFWTLHVPLSVKRNFCYENGYDFSHSMGYAFEIINKNGEPCFFFPYYEFKNGVFAGTTLTIEGYNVNHKYFTVFPNGMYIFIPSELSDFFSDVGETCQLSKKVSDFFVAPALGEMSTEGGLQCTVSIVAEAPYGYIADNLTTGRNMPIKHEIPFRLQPGGGYTAGGSFACKITSYSISS